MRKQLLIGIQWFQGSSPKYTLPTAISHMITVLEWPAECRVLYTCYIPHQYTGRPHTNKYLSFAYHHPMAHTVAVVRTFMTTANALSSSGVDWEEEKKRTVEALKENGYPSSYIHGQALMCR